MSATKTTTKTLTTPTTKKVRRYGRIDKDILVQALGAGLTKTQAGRLAGSKAVEDRNIISTVNTVIDNPKNIDKKKTVIELLKERQRWLLEAIKQSDMEKAPINQKTVALGIITDKLQLLKGDPTERIETIPRMVITQGNKGLKGQPKRPT